MTTRSRVHSSEAQVLRVEGRNTAAAALKTSSSVGPTWYLQFTRPIKLLVTTVVSHKIQPDAITCTRSRELPKNLWIWQNETILHANKWLILVQSTECKKHLSRRYKFEHNIIILQSPEKMRKTNEGFLPDPRLMCIVYQWKKRSLAKKYQVLQLVYNLVTEKLDNAVARYYWDSTLSTSIARAQCKTGYDKLDFVSK